MKHRGSPHAQRFHRFGERRQHAHRLPAEERGGRNHDQRRDGPKRGPCSNRHINRLSAVRNRRKVRAFYRLDDQRTCVLGCGSWPARITRGRTWIRWRRSSPTGACAVLPLRMRRGGRFRPATAPAPDRRRATPGTSRSRRRVRPPAARCNSRGTPPRARPGICRPRPRRPRRFHRQITPRSAWPFRMAVATASAMSG